MEAAIEASNVLAADAGDQRSLLIMVIPIAVDSILSLSSRFSRSLTLSFPVRSSLVAVGVDMIDHILHGD
jgi:hypothetical protein